MRKTLKRDTAAFIDLSRELLDAGYAVKFRASGSSMRPAIHDGDTLIAESVDPAAVKAGDILLFDHRQRAVAHRVVNIREENGLVVEFVVRGDAKAERAVSVTPREVLGRVTRPSGQNTWRNVLGRLGARRLRQVFRSLSSRASAARHHALPPRANRHT